MAALTMLDVIVHWHILSGLRFTCLNSPVVSGIQPAHAAIPIPRRGDRFAHSNHREIEVSQILPLPLSPLLARSSPPSGRFMGFDEQNQ